MLGTFAYYCCVWHSTEWPQLISFNILRLLLKQLIQGRKGSKHTKNIVFRKTTLTREAYCCIECKMSKINEIIQPLKAPTAIKTNTRSQGPIKRTPVKREFNWCDICFIIIWSAQRQRSKSAHHAQRIKCRLPFTSLEADSTPIDRSRLMTKSLKALWVALFLNYS